MPPQPPFKMELLEEDTTEAWAQPKADMSAQAREAQLQLAEARVTQIAQQQQKAAIYIQTLLQILGLRCLLLLGLVGSTVLTWQILTNPTATIATMILTATTSALLVLPLVWLIARKG